MFAHHFKYAVMSLVRGKDTIFWTLAFPILLFTFMYLAFGNLMEQDEMFRDISVAVVRNSDSETDMPLMMMLAALSADGDDKLLDVTEMNETEALSALSDGTVTGVIDTADASLTLAENSIEGTILAELLNQYKQMESIYMDTLSSQGEEAAQEGLMQMMAEDRTYYTETSTSDGCQNEYYNYFYAVLAMSCLFASFAGTTRICKLQANVSALGMRRCLAPSPKLVTVCAEYLALVLVQFIVEMISMLYMLAFGVDFGDRYPAFILALFVGCNIGVAVGMLIGAIPKASYGAKMGIASAFGLVSSFLSDLMIGGVKSQIEHHAPLLNRINPAALLTDSLYSLNVYEGYERYAGDLIIMAAMTVLLLVSCVLLLRRNRYASV